MTSLLPSSQYPPVQRSTAYLDGVRGLAAFLVVIHHYFPSYSLGMHDHGFGEDGQHYYLSGFPFLRIIFGGGDASVSIFFVLSGFVLTQSPLKLMLVEKLNGAARLTLTSSIVRRPLRLYIPALCVALLTVFAMHLPFGPYQITFFQPLETLSEELSNYLFTSLGFFNPFQTHDNAHWYQYGMPMWTIPIELKGSMLVYGLVFFSSFMPRRTRLMIIANCVLFVILLAFGQWTMACFIAGMLLSYNEIRFLDSPVTQRLTKRGVTMLNSTIFVLGYWLLCEPSAFDRPETAANTPGWKTLHRLVPARYDNTIYYRFWHTIGAVFFIYSVLRLGWLQRFFSIRPLQYLGKVSFMLYLTHLPVLFTAGEVLRCGLGACFNLSGDELPWYQDIFWIPDIGPIGFNSRWLISITLVSLVCLPVAHLATVVIDDPCVRLGKKLSRALGLERRRRPRIVLPETRQPSMEYVAPLLDV